MMSSFQHHVKAIKFGVLHSPSHSIGSARTQQKCYPNNKPQRPIFIIVKGDSFVYLFSRLPLLHDRKIITKGDKMLENN